MKINILFLFFIVLIIACNNGTPGIDPEPEPEPELDSCELYATGIYNDTLPGKVPQKFWPCMNTEDLVEAGSYNFPALYMLMGGCCGLQSGYDLCRNKYSWFEDLENREDALPYLIAKYASIDTVNYNMDLLPIEWGGYTFYTYNLEVFLAQEAYLNNATNEQRITLLNELTQKQEIRGNEKGAFGIEGPTFAMARVMYFGNYEPLIDSMNQNYFIKALVDHGSLNKDSVTRIEIQRTIFTLTSNYIDNIKK